MRLLYLVATFLVALVLSKAQPERDCPSDCKCEPLGTTGIIAKCSTLDPNQKFNLEITALELTNVPKSSGLNLTDRIFENIGLKRLSSIKIVNSSIINMDVNSFRGLHNLYNLNLTGNQLGLLEPDMFVDNMHLEMLSLNHNPLEYMQADPSPYESYFLNIPALQELYLSNCNLSHLLPTMFTRLTTVVYVNLAYNDIEDISNETFAPLVDLDEVDLSHNKLTHLKPDVFQNNIELSILRLNNNPLTTISDLILPYLQTLDISHCLFETVDGNSFEKFTDLRSLNLNGNKISSLPSDSFKSLKKLQYLDISSNGLTGVLPDDLFINNPQLETIKMKNNPEMKNLPSQGFQGDFIELYLFDASNCGLTHLEERSFKKMKRLSFLYLNDNKIEYLKPGVLNPKIVHLELSRNQISYMDQVSFAANSWLRKLYLNENPLKKLSPNNFVNVPRLTKLYIKSCGLNKLWEMNDEKIQHLKSLNYLNVANNQIKNITLKDLSYIERVQTLILTGNPLTCTDELQKAVTYLVSSGVASSEATEKKHLDESRYDRSEHDVQVEIKKDNLGWNTFINSVCKKSQKLVDTQTYDPYYETTNEEEDITETTENGETNTDVWETVYWGTSYDPMVPVVDIHSEPIEHNTTNYMWPIIIVSLSAFAIILSLVVLAAFLLRWNRQKNSYRNKIIKRHMLSNTPRLKRGSGTVYQQLYEDPNLPTTPVMSAKLTSQNAGEHRTYTPVDSNSATQPTTNASYLSSPFHHSNIVPETV